MTSPPPKLYTLGHSTRTLEEFLAILKKHHIEILIDVRTMPRSRRVPHFNIENLSEFLPLHQIEYLHIPALGGLRKPRSDSINTAWRTASFRGYADYMQTPQFQSALDQLINIASKRTA